MTTAITTLLRAALRRLPGRWFTALDIGEKNNPHLSRLRIYQCRWFGIYLHHIFRPDREPDPHDHPWPWFFSLVLCGWYEELIVPDKRNPAETVRRERPRGSLGWMTGRSAHRITGTSGTLWTVVLAGPKTSEWGFWPRGEFVRDQDYEYAGTGEGAAR